MIPGPTDEQDLALDEQDPALFGKVCAIMASAASASTGTPGPIEKPPEEGHKPSSQLDSPYKRRLVRSPAFTSENGLSGGLGPHPSNSGGITVLAVAWSAHAELVAQNLSDTANGSAVFTAID